MSSELRYEDAAQVRDRAERLTEVLGRQDKIRTILSAGDVWIRRSSHDDGDGEDVVIRDGALVSATVGSPPVDREQAFALAPDRAESEWVEWEQWEEIQILWRHLTKGDVANVEIKWCSGLEHLPV